METMVFNIRRSPYSEMQLNKTEARGSVLLLRRWAKKDKDKKIRRCMRILLLRWWSTLAKLRSVLF